MTTVVRVDDVIKVVCTVCGLRRDVRRAPDETVEVRHTCGMIESFEITRRKDR